MLGLESNASKDEIKKAYRIYAKKIHPDKQNGDKFFEERFKEILEAYEILSEDSKRANYDSKRTSDYSNGASAYNRQSYSNRNFSRLRHSYSQKFV
ncbi:MAG: DnaJ domain-containing protein [Bacteroidales bacterium]|nr:DnaJ domain-containing protein [Bacteroidales bacterium]